MVPAGWTDVQGHALAPTWNSILGSVEDLRRSRTVVDALQRRLAGNDGEKANLAVESACAKQAEFHGGSSDPATIGVGSTGGGRKERGH